jgi:hypothetical protein
MENTKAGWTFDDLERLYTGFGFRMREGAKHTVYTYPDYPQIRATVRRSNPIPKGYIEHALQLLRLRDALTEKAKGDE